MTFPSLSLSLVSSVQICTTNKSDTVKTGSVPWWCRLTSFALMLCRVSFTVIMTTYIIANCARRRHVSRQSQVLGQCLWWWKRHSYTIEYYLISHSKKERNINKCSLDCNQSCVLLWKYKTLSNGWDFTQYNARLWVKLTLGKLMALGWRWAVFLFWWELTAGREGLSMVLKVRLSIND
jgi:hypothetical protein